MSDFIIKAEKCFEVRRATAEFFNNLNKRLDDWFAGKISDRELFSRAPFPKERAAHSTGCEICKRYYTAEAKNYNARRASGLEQEQKGDK